MEMRFKKLNLAGEELSVPCRQLKHDCRLTGSQHKVATDRSWPLAADPTYRLLSLTRDHQRRTLNGQS